MTISTEDPEHTCHAEACSEVVPPRVFMCPEHWFMLPKALRDALWSLYVPGQETRKDPSSDYINVAQRCIGFVAVKDGRRRVGQETS